MRGGGKEASLREDRFLQNGGPETGVGAQHLRESPLGKKRNRKRICPVRKKKEKDFFRNPRREKKGGEGGGGPVGCRGSCDLEKKKKKKKKEKEEILTAPPKTLPQFPQAGEKRRMGKKKIKSSRLPMSPAGKKGKKRNPLRSIRFNERKEMGLSAMFRQEKT